MLKSTALVSGYIRAEADATHPLQTRLSLIITDFEPNGNKQAIPLSEKQNIINSALHMPLKINFDGQAVSGHVGAIPIGPITSAFESTDNGRDVIAGEAVVWNEIYDDVADHLKIAFAEGIGTSWEIYYEKIEIDSDDIQWLQGCVFAGTCIVHTPAYGPTRTRVLAIAEELNKHADQLERLTMANSNTTNAEADVETLQDDLSSAMDVLSTIYEGLWNMFDKTFEIEQNLATTDMSAMADKFSKLIAQISKQFNELKDKAGLADAAQAELATLKEKLQRIESEQQEQELLTARRVKLAEAGIELTDATLSERKTFYLGMSEETFTQYIADLTAVRGKAATASLDNPVIPEPSSGSNTMSVKEIAAALRAR